MLPLYEAKMIHHYDTRWATYEHDGSVRDVTKEEKRAGFAPIPRYWVHESEVDKKLEGKWDKPWMLGWRDICRSTDERTTIATKVPRVAIGNNLPLAFPDASNDEASAIQALLSSYAVDFVARQKVGGTHLNFFLFSQLPVASQNQIRKHLGWIAERVDRLNSQGIDQPIEDQIRTEIDAFVFRLYGVSREDVSYILDRVRIESGGPNSHDFGLLRT